MSDVGPMTGAPPTPDQTAPLSAPILDPNQLPLPPTADLAFWRGEVDRADAAMNPLYPKWQENIQYYIGESPDAKTAKDENADFVNVNVDFSDVETKLSQLFYETPDLQMIAKGDLEQHPEIIQAHRDLMNDILGPDHADVLQTAVHPAIKDCLCVSGTGPVMIGYQPTMQDVPTPPELSTVPGAQATTPLPVHQKWYTLRFSGKKFLRPSEFHATDWDRAPWLGMRFRMPLVPAKREFQLPADFSGTTTRDEFVLNDQSPRKEPSGVPYVDGQVIWYYTSLFDESVIHPERMRELVLIDGLDQPARHRDSPHQTVQPDGRLSADSLIGNPIHPLTIRTVPDSADVPSDSQMTRPLVRELCKFRSQMVQERDANIPRILYDSEKFPPEVLAKIVNGSVGSMIGLEPGALAQGLAAIMAVVQQGTSPRQTYIANDYITRDIEKTLAIDAAGAGISDQENRQSATKTAVIDRNRNVRLGHEQRQVLRWYLKLVAKMSTLVCRYMSPQAAIPYLGQQKAQVWAQWNKQTDDSRLVFDAKPDSQIKLDAAAERKFWLDIYQFVAKDPNCVRVKVLSKLFEVAGENPQDFVVAQLPPQHPEPGITFNFKGEDLIGPQAPMVREILAQGGIQITPDAIQESASQLLKQVTLGVRDANGKATPAITKPMEHGGTADQVRPLSQQTADQTGQRSGPKTGVAA